MDRDKEHYFQDIYSLQDASDGEEDTSDAKEVLERSRALPRLSTVASQSSSIRHKQQATLTKKIPTMHRTVSEPTPSTRIVQETPTLQRHGTLLRHGISRLRAPAPHVALPTFNDHVDLSIDRPQSSDEKKPETARGTSTPVIGSVFMTNSTGINLLLKKRKRKDSAIKLVPEEERVLAGQVFYYIPADDVALLRKSRISKARSYGAVWAREWSTDITHVVVDKAITYMEVLNYLKPSTNSDALPPNVILVNEDYPMDCTEFRTLLDATQKRYMVKGADRVVASNIEPELESTKSQQSENSLRVKESKRSKYDDHPANRTPTPSQYSILSGEQLPRLESSPGVWILSEVVGQVDFGKNDTETAPQAIPGTSQDDDLDAMIKVAQSLDYLPIDDEDEEDRPSSRDDPIISGSGDDAARIRIPKHKYQKTPMGQRNPLHQDNFSCMQGGTGAALEDNPNKEMIDILQEMADYYSRIHDQWRSRSYRQAIGTLKKQTCKISTYEEFIGLPNIGHRLAEKLEEIAQTHRLRRLDTVKLQPEDQTLQLFLKIYGVGLQQASRWVTAGYRTLDDLKVNVELKKNQRLGIEHFDDLNTRIPRKEVSALGEVVKTAIAAIDSSVEATIGGSYRRGAETSGDIDFILTRPGTTSCKELAPFLHELTTALTASNFLVAALAVPRHDDGSKWHGVCVLPGSRTWRRIDFLLVPYSEMGAALIYFTGDDIFNRSIRLLASRKGMRLNQRGLYEDVMRGPGRIRITEGALVEAQDERKIFEILGVPWRPPEQRICH